MSFFLPSRLVDLEYLGVNSDKSEIDDEEARQYYNDIDFAFFVVNFNYTKQAYWDLTPKEKVFIVKQWENKIIRDTTFMRNAFLNATYNANRKKNAQFKDLWVKQITVDVATAKEDIKLIEEIEQLEGKSWVEMIYQANGWRPTERSD